MTLIYRTLEGERWAVKNCRPHQELPDFYIGERHTDGRTVTVHIHRCEQAQEPVPNPVQNGNAS